MVFIHRPPKGNLPRKRKREGNRKPKKKRRENHKSGIDENRWLNDKDILAATKLLHDQFKDLIGMFDTVLGQNLSFPVCKDPFIQILHVGGNHWITVAGVSPSLVHVYDSLYNTVHDDTVMQVAAIMHTAEHYVDFKVHKIQFQKGTSDCGLFSIAYATDLAFGNDPASYMYKQDLLRSHFASCISSNKLTPFPSEPIKYQRPKTVRNTVLCTCSLPDNGKEKMVQCNDCQDWFHQSCEHIPETAFKCSSAVWRCSKCTQK